MTPHEFEVAVADLLRLSGYDVKGETLIGHKKVDVYAEERRWGKSRRVAVECKYYARPLTQEQVNEIYSNYRPLYDGDLIDEVLLVTSNGVAATSEAFVGLARGLSHVTLAQLQNSVIDFSGYLQTLSRQVHEDGLASYYVRPKTGLSDLEEFVSEWVEQSAKPLAILGSYGMGKTSFVRHFAAKLAEHAMVDAGSRIPVIIKLAEISAEQSLEGLLGRIFTTTRSVRNYSFEAFMELNARGRFVVFLDGFDEMKHTLVWDQFRFNFKEINRLVVHDSRVMLLGRPTAFMSDAEQQYILHGIRRGSEGALRDPNWPDYEELQLQPFTREQVRQFLAGYATYLSSSGKVPAANAEEILKQIDELPPDKLADLAERPVQLRILSEVLPQWKGEVTELTSASLYSTFINIVIEREQEKVSRARFGLRERRDFARTLAYWLWTNGAGMSIDASRIPAELFPPAKGDDTAEGVRRDMVSACFLDKKYGEALYFPHRSFQEFLVAEKIVFDVRNAYIDLRRLSIAVTPEVGEFVTALVELDDFQSFSGVLKRHTGAIGLALLRAWVESQEIARHVVGTFQSGDRSPWSIILTTIVAMGRTPAIVPAEFLAALARPEHRPSPRTRLLALLCGAMLTETLYDDPSVTRAFVNLFRHYFETAYEESTRRYNGFDALARFAQSKYVEASLARMATLVPIADPFPRIAVDFRRAAHLLGNEFAGETMVYEWPDAIRNAQPGRDRRFQFVAELNPRVIVDDDVAGATTLLGVFCNRLRRRGGEHDTS